MRSRQISSKKWEASEALKKAQGFLCALAFMMLLAGTNIPTPLLPLYRDELGFAPVIVTLTYSVYVATLVAVLLLFSRPSIVRHYPVMIVASLLLAIWADLMLSTGSVWGILSGRALSGVSGGVGTGAASALVVAALGERGRALSATGNLAGAILGTTVSQILLGVFGVAAIRINYEVHAGACILLLIPLISTLVGRRGENRAQFETRDSVPEAVLPVLKENSLVIVCGVLSWMTISLSIVLLPTYFSDHAMRGAQAAGIPVLLTSSLIAQLASPILPVFLRGMTGLGLAALGATLLFGGVMMSTSVVSLCGFALVGFGAGFSYRTSLILLCQNASPALQGRLATFYAAITYSFAAVIVLFAGWFVQKSGQDIATHVLFALCAALLIGFGKRARSLEGIRLLRIKTK